MPDLKIIIFYKKTDQRPTDVKNKIKKTSSSYDRQSAIQILVWFDPRFRYLSLLKVLIKQVLDGKEPFIHDNRSMFYQGNSKWMYQNNAYGL